MGVVKIQVCFVDQSNKISTLLLCATTKIIKLSKRQPKNYGNGFRINTLK